MRTARSTRAHPIFVWLRPVPEEQRDVATILGVGKGAGDRFTRAEMDFTVSYGCAVAAHTHHGVKLPLAHRLLGHVLVTGQQVTERLALAIIQEKAAQITAEFKPCPSLRVRLLDDRDRASLDVGESAHHVLTRIEVHPHADWAISQSNKPPSPR
jgi:hypothetical protein